MSKEKKKQNNNKRWSYMAENNPGGFLPLKADNDSAVSFSSYRIKLLL